MDGLLIIDKPAGITSHDVVGRARRILREKRIGHTGTLDPFATGVLVLMVGRATRLARFLGGAEKEYEAVIRFGYATNTGDFTGERLDTEKEIPLETANLRTLIGAQVAAAMGNLTGQQLQTPPMYSAKKVQGKKLYELARQGKEIERQAVSVNISEFELLQPDNDESPFVLNDDDTMDLAVRVVCSAGTYIRTLGETLAESLGAKGHLAVLRRTRAGQFSVSRAVTLEQLAEKVEKGESRDLIVSPSAALPELPFLHLTEQDMRKVRNGMVLDTDKFSDAEISGGVFIRLLNDSDELVAIAESDESGRKVSPRIVMAGE